MIPASAVVPHPPLFLPELTGDSANRPAQVLELVSVSLAAVSWLLDQELDTMVVIGEAEHPGSWPSDASFDGGRYLGRAGNPLATLPLSLGIGARLLDRAGWSGDRSYRAIAAGANVDACLAMGAELASSPRRTGLLVMAEGSARRSQKAPGHLDSRAEAYDAAVVSALASGDAAAIGSLDTDLAAELMVQGRTALQVLAGAMPTVGTCTVGYDAAPYGVQYTVATWKAEQANTSA